MFCLLNCLKAIFYYSIRIIFVLLYNKNIYLNKIGYCRYLLKYNITLMIKYDIIEIKIIV